MANQYKGETNELRRGVSLDGPAEVLAGVLGGGAQLLLNAQDLVVLGEALGAARRARLDLPRGETHHQVSDERVLGFTGPGE